jgi:hypothetical protein
MVTIFDEEEYDCEAPSQPLYVKTLTLRTTHYRLLEWFLARVQPIEHLVIEVASKDIWFVEKIINTLGIRCHRFDLYTQRLIKESFYSFQRIKAF